MKSMHPRRRANGYTDRVPGDAGKPFSRAFLLIALLGAAASPACNAIFGLGDFTVDDGHASSAGGCGCPSGEGSCFDGKCEGGACVQVPKPAGTACSDDGGRVCGDDGACVQCIVTADCPEGVCDANLCVDVACTDGVKGGTETDVDCGGACAGCSPGKACEAGPDCLSGVCTSAMCQVPSCVDGVKNGSETDVDCGAGCAPCGDGLACLESQDCVSKICDIDVCVAAGCIDGIQNGGETAIDCGDPCAGCPEESPCVVADDCQSGLCEASACKLLNGCGPANAQDLTGQPEVTIAVGSPYSPKCFVITAGTLVTFQGDFKHHGLEGGEIVGATKLPDASSPFMPATTGGTSKTFDTLTTPGNFGFYCQQHGTTGHDGAAFVVP